MSRRSRKGEPLDHPLEIHFRSFLDRLRNEKRLQESSLEQYRLEIGHLLRVLKAPEASEIKAELATKAPATHRRKLIIYQAFLSTCPSPWNTLLTEVSRPKIRQKQPRFLNQDEAFRLEAACYRSRTPNRDRLFLAFGLQLGLRLSEILHLKYKDIEIDWVRIIRKGNKEQRLPLTASLQSLIQFLKKEQSAKSDDYIFQGAKGGPMSSRNAQKILDRLAKSAEIREKISPHALRHSFATKLAANGASLVALKEFLGHESIRTTERYLHVTPQHLRETLSKLKPIN